MGFFMSEMLTDTALAQSIGRAIAKYRLMAGLTQAQVAERLNISNEAVSRMERGTIMPTVARLIQLAHIFDCEATDLLKESSHSIHDQARRLIDLMKQLNDTERQHLLGIVEMMVAFYTMNKKYEA